MAEYKVLTGALTLKTDKDGKKVKRFYRGQTVNLEEFHDVEHLKAIGAIGDQDARYPTAAGIAVLAARSNDANIPAPVDDGAVAQDAPVPDKTDESADLTGQQASDLDDGGVGSDDTTPPAEQSPSEASAQENTSTQKPGGSRAGSARKS